MSTGATKARSLTGLVTVPSSREYRDWTDRLAEHCRSSRAAVIDQGLLLLAEQVGFNEPAPRR